MRNAQKHHEIWCLIGGLVAAKAWDGGSEVVTENSSPDWEPPPGLALVPSYLFLLFRPDLGLVESQTCTAENSRRICNKPVRDRTAWAVELSV